MAYSRQQLERLWVQAGGSPKVAGTMAAIALRESSGNPNAQNKNTNGTIDRGLWQINSIWGKRSTFDVLANARAAVHVYNVQGPRAWTTYKTGAYKSALGGGGGGSGQTTTPGVDNSSARSQALISYLYGPSTPDAAVNFARNTQAAQDVPGQTMTTRTQGSGSRVTRGLGAFDGKHMGAWMVPALRYARANGWKGTVISGFRSVGEQAQLYNQYQAGKRAGPVAKPGQSSHNSGNAVDVTDPNGLAKALGSYRGQKPIQGLAINDPNHFSNTGR